MTAKHDEVWKPIIGYEGLYEVSNYGRVRSLDHYVLHWKGGKRLHTGRILKPHEDRYLKVGLSRDNIVKTYRVHNLVMRMFVGRPPPNMEICHNDGVKSNCKLENLRYGTHAENIKDRDVHGKTHRGSNNVTSILTEENVREIRKMYQTKEANQYELADKFGIHQSQIWRIIHRKAWAWLPDAI